MVETYTNGTGLVALRLTDSVTGCSAEIRNEPSRIRAMEKAKKLLEERIDGLYPK